MNMITPRNHTQKQILECGLCLFQEYLASTFRMHGHDKHLIFNMIENTQDLCSGIRMQITDTALCDFALDGYDALTTQEKMSIGPGFHEYARLFFAVCVSGKFFLYVDWKDRLTEVIKKYFIMK